MSIKDTYQEVQGKFVKLDKHAPMTFYKISTNRMLEDTKGNQYKLGASTIQFVLMSGKPIGGPICGDVPLSHHSVSSWYLLCNCVDDTLTFMAEGSVTYVGEHPRACGFSTEFIKSVMGGKE